MEWKDLNYFDGSSYVKVPSEEVNFEKWIIEAKIRLLHLDKTQYILHKRNGQHHYNFCLMYTDPNFVHYRTGMQGKARLVLSVGNGGYQSDDFECSVCIEVDLKERELFGVICSYNQEWLMINHGGIYHRREMSLTGISGDGPLIIGAPGEPYTSGWPEFNAYPMFGAIEHLKIEEL